MLPLLMVSSADGDVVADEVSCHWSCHLRCDVDNLLQGFIMKRVEAPSLHDPTGN